MGGDGHTDVCSDDVGGAEEPGGLASSSTRSPRDVSPAARAERPAVAQVKASVHPLPARRKRQPATGDGDDSAPRRTGIGEGGLQLREGHRRSACGGELDRQRSPVKFAADTVNGLGGPGEPREGAAVRSAARSDAPADGGGASSSGPYGLVSRRRVRRRKLRVPGNPATVPEGLKTVTPTFRVRANPPSHNASEAPGQASVRGGAQVVVSLAAPGDINRPASGTVTARTRPGIRWRVSRDVRWAGWQP